MSSKTERLINLIAMLSDTMRPLTRHEILAAIPGYNSGSESSSRRTFERDKDELRKMGFDIVQVSTPDGDYGYRINRDNTFYSVSLNGAQRNIVQCALAIYSPDKNITSKSLTKLGGINPENELENVQSLSLPQNVSVLFKFCTVSANISFKYREELRRVRTKKLVAKSGYWYLECFDLDKKELRNFRVDRLSDIEEIQNTSEIETADFKNEIDTSTEGMVTIVVRVNEDLKAKFIKDWNAIELGDTIEFKVPRVEIFALRYFDYVGYVEVIAPQELVKTIDSIFDEALLNLEGSK